MDILSGIPELQLDFEKIYNYFQNARKLIAQSNKTKCPPPETGNATTVVEAATTPAPKLPQTCVCHHLRSSLSPKLVKTYKHLLSVISADVNVTSPKDSPVFEEFQALHCQIQEAQRKVVADLSACCPCSHLVLPINLEELLIHLLHKQQMRRALDAPSIYAPVDSTKFKVAKSNVTKLEHVGSFGEPNSLPRFVLAQGVLPTTIKDAAFTGDATPECTEISPDANVITSVDVVQQILTFLNSGTRCFFPVDVVPSPHRTDKRVVLIHSPLLSEPLNDSRLRAQECYSLICQTTFLEHPTSGSAPCATSSVSDSRERALVKDSVNKDTLEPDQSDLDELEVPLTIDPDVAASPSEASMMSPVALRAVIDQCDVVESTKGIEVLQEPASPEPASPFTPTPCPPVTTKPTPKDGKLWNLFKLGEVHLLVRSSGVRLTPESCAFACKKDGSDSTCVFWPNCAELWSGAPVDGAEKIVHLDVRPEYLQPWGCEDLSDAEIFSSCLGAHLSCPEKPEVLRLRVEASTGRVIFAEVQTIDQLLQAHPKFQFGTHISPLAAILSALARLDAGKYLLSSRSVCGKTTYQLYELAADTANSQFSVSQTNGAINLHALVTDGFEEACRSLIAPSLPTDQPELGASWRRVKRFPLDLSIPSGVTSCGLLIPGIDVLNRSDSDSPSPAPVSDSADHSGAENVPNPPTNKSPPLNDDTKSPPTDKSARTSTNSPPATRSTTKRAHTDGEQPRTPKRRSSDRSTSLSVDSPKSPYVTRSVRAKMSLENSPSKTPNQTRRSRRACLD
uniref:NARG2_C domain-containing protein n=1 Tax=Mesocestoides corti TaxID=53468 RepID=A0A5K3EJV4_MESCO